MTLSRDMGRRVLLRTSAPALFFAAFAAAAQADFAEGVEAYDGGDLETAVAAWREAAAEGDLEAVVALAGLYAEGSGLPQDWQAAARLYRRAADAGDKIAQLNLGELYATGRGVERDLLQAYLWYGLAAKQGSAWAARELAAVTRALPGDALARAKTLLEECTPPQP
jgi:TPR repeat protein